MPCPQKKNKCENNPKKKRSTMIMKRKILFESEIVPHTDTHLNMIFHRLLQREFLIYSIAKLSK